MLIRIRRLAGSFIGAAFILLLALSMLQMGESMNPLAMFQSSPVVLEVGKENQRFNTLQTVNSVSNVLPVSAEAYQDTGYGPLLTAMAVEDSWAGADFSASSDFQAQVQGITTLNQGASREAISQALARFTPLAAVVTAVGHPATNAADLLPRNLADIPAQQVQQAYDFEVIRVLLDLENETFVPTQEEQEVYLAENQENFQRAPSWNINAIVIRDTDLAATTEVSEDQIRQHYEDTKTDYATPERWELLTLTFGTELEATLFQAQVDQGTSPVQALAASTASISGEGLRTQEALTNAEADLARALNPGDLSEGLTRDDGTVTYNLLRSYEPAVNLNFDEARNQVQRALRLELAQSQLSSLANSLLRQAARDGKSLEILAEENGLVVQPFEDLQNAQTAPAPLNQPAFFERLTRITSPSEAVRRATLVANSQEVLYEVTAYEPVRNLSLEEASQAVISSWQVERAQDLADSRAQSAKSALKEGVTGSDIVAELGAEVASLETFTGLSRLGLNQAEGGLSSIISQLDSAARARLTGQLNAQTDQFVLALNPDLTSPFVLGDGGTMIANMGGSRVVIRAVKSDVVPEGEVRPALINILADRSASQLYQAALYTAYLNDVADGRDPIVEETIIADQRAYQQQQIQEAQARHGGGL